MNSHQLDQCNLFTHFHGHAFPPLSQREAWVRRLMYVRPALRRFEAEQEWISRSWGIFPILSGPATLRGNIVIPPKWCNGKTWWEWIPWDEI